MVQYKTFKNSVTKQLRNARNTYFKNLFIGVKSDIKKTWHSVNWFFTPNQAKKNNSIKLLICNDIEYKAKQDIFCKLNQFIASTGREISNSFHSTDELPRNI